MPHPTVCSRCKHIYVPNKSAQPWYWLCIKHPRLNEGFGFVTDETWDNAPPYLRCADVNAGACPLYEEADYENSDQDNAEVREPA